jgi:acyl-ACP thioesterase
MTNKFSMPFTVSLHDAGPGGSIKIPVLFNYFQGVTGAHANSIGFGGADILKKGYTWVISRYRLSVIKLPGLFDKFIITTWRSGESGNFAIREFLITDEKGNTLVQATSSWMLLNFIKKEAVIPSTMYPGYPVNPERALDDSFSSVPEISRSQYEKEFSVRRYDLDMNNHVNNSIYAAWIIEAGEDLNEKRALRDIVLNFKGEVRYGESVISQAVNDIENGRIIHRLICKDSGKEITRGITEWR